MTPAPRTPPPPGAGPDSPDLRARFLDTIAELRLAMPGDAAWEEIVQGYAEPHRHYHTLEHIGRCLAHLAETPHDTPTLRLALYYHDVIYDACGDQNELLSARFATGQLQALGLADTHTAVIYDLIRATDHRPGALADHADLICDIDLAILGAEWPDYTAYASAIRRENSWVPEGKYRGARIRILEAFLQRPGIYQTAAFRKRFETNARDNLAAEISALVSGRPLAEER